MNEDEHRMAESLLLKKHHADCEAREWSCATGVDARRRYDARFLQAGGDAADARALDAQGNLVGWSDHLADVPLSYQWADPEKRKPDGSEMAPRPIYPIAEYRTGFTPIESCLLYTSYALGSQGRTCGRSGYRRGSCRHLAGS